MRNPLSLASAIVLGLVVMMVCTHAHAVPVLTETYSYPDGELATASGGVWVNSSGTTDGQTVVSGALFINDNGNKDYTRAFGSTISSGTVYAGFDLTVATVDGPSATTFQNAYFLHFGSGSTFAGRVLLANGDNAGDFKIGVIRGAGVDATLWPTDLVEGQTYHVVLGYEIGTNIATLWINPTSIGDTNITNNGGTTNPANLTFIGTRVDGTPDGDKTLDNLIVSTSFADVVPEPSALALLGLTLFALPRRRRAV